MKSCLARIQYLPTQEKDQIQDIRNWVENSPETSTQSTPESPIIGLIENSTTSSPNMDTLGTSKEPVLKVPVPTPSATARVFQVLLDLAVIKLKGRRIPLFDWYPFRLCHNLPRRS